MKKLLLAVSLTMTLTNQVFALEAGTLKRTIFTEVCEDDEVFFQDFPSAEAILLGKNYEAKDVATDLHLYLGPDRTYYANYSESVVIQKPDGAFFKGGFKNLFSSRLKGTYQITPEGTIVFDNLGIGSNAQGAQGEVLMNLEFTHAINDLGAVGKVIQIQMFNDYGRCFKK